MSEVLLFQIGRCGNRIGQQFWQQIINEHSIPSDGRLEGQPSAGTNIYFQEFKKCLTPRCLQVDFGIECIDSITNGPLGKLYVMQNQIQGMKEVDGTWAQGMYATSQEIDLTLEVVRRLYESCDKVSGIQFCHSLSGRTGSGFGSYLMNKTRQNYPGPIIQSIAHLPSEATSTNVVQIYNTVFSMTPVLESSTMTNYFQNEGLTRICLKEPGIDKPQYKDMNKVVAKIIAATTVSMRFPGSQNTNMRKIATNLIPFPRLHFFGTGIAPIGRTKDHSARNLIDMAYSKDSFCAQKDWRLGKLITTANLFSGPFSTSQIQTLLLKHKQNNSKKYLQWIFDNNHYCLAEAPTPPSLVTFMNASSFRLVLKDFGEKFTGMFRRKAFMHHYTVHGMDEMEFTEAESNINDMVSEFPESSCTGCFYDDEDEWEGEMD